jgi:hypothetical protein
MTALAKDTCAAGETVAIFYLIGGGLMVVAVECGWVTTIHLSDRQLIGEWQITILFKTIIELLARNFYSTPMKTEMA